ncbi:hypothetical protein KF7HA_02326 [Lactococcus lactis]|nr:hypothetical protein [Lactococcus lactis]
MTSKIIKWWEILDWEFQGFKEAGYWADESRILTSVIKDEMENRVLEEI